MLWCHGVSGGWSGMSSWKISLCGRRVMLVGCKFSFFNVISLLSTCHIRQKTHLTSGMHPYEPHTRRKVVICTIMWTPTFTRHRIMHMRNQCYFFFVGSVYNSNIVLHELYKIERWQGSEGSLSLTTLGWQSDLGGRGQSLLSSGFTHVWFWVCMGVCVEFI